MMRASRVSTQPAMARILLIGADARMSRWEMLSRAMGGSGHQG